MNKILNTIKKNLDRYIRRGDFRAKFTYTKYYEKLPIEEKLILIQSYDGSSISGNPYYLLKELCENPAYEEYRKVVVDRVLSENVIREQIERNGWKNVEVVKIHSAKYCKILATASYLINNSTFPVYFIKKEGQTYLNTWHGTPLKTLGKRIKAAPNEIGNTQRNFMMADYLLYPNKFTFERMKKDYMLDNLFKGKYLISGYPRNEAFFDEEKKKQIIKKYKLENKKIAVFMPTWKGTLETKNVDQQMAYIKQAIYEMEAKLNDNIVVYVKLHNYVKQTLDLNKLNKIKEIPHEYETYEFLNIADCLITDYSSVLFDFMNTQKKIILYAYDLDKYIDERGMYLDFKSLPFSLTYNSIELIDEINNIDIYQDYSKKMNHYIAYDDINASKKICNYILKKQLDSSIEVIEGESFANGKKNVLMFPGVLNKNGITTAFNSLIDSVNRKDNKNYLITFYKNKVKNNLDYVKEFVKKDYDYLVIQGQKNMTFSEALCHFLYFKCEFNTKFIRKKIKNIFDREIKRIYPNLDFEYAIHFSGYESNIMHMISSMNTKKIIWAHNNMYKEEKSKGNFHKNSLKNSYNTFDKIVVVRESMKEELKKYIKSSQQENIVVVHNINDIEGIKEKAKKEVEFQDSTYCNVEIEELNRILNDKEITKFINIARFSKEKGLDRLIKAFDKYRTENDKKAYLIIIGGYGKEFKNILNMIQKVDGTVKIENVIIIKSIMNPYPILNKCNAFVLSSIYEGLPMTIMEALILGKTVISTNIIGPREFLEKGYGYLVENSIEGLANGLKDFKNGKITKIKKFNSEEFNKKAEKEFHSIVK